MIRIGFIGCGGVAREYLSRLNAMPDDARVIAFCDLDLARAHALAAGYEARVYDDYRVMLDAEALDTVFDNLPPFARADELICAAEHGCAIFTTKPLGLNLETAQH
ncbi:MAG: Gfo/Idh/MocA family oxidoreductase, partial [Chloroflexi bacterium]|nr:Gfo/Idh/MocA family oxidoreductase [Chloroflexota bacterium]